MQRTLALIALPAALALALLACGLPAPVPTVEPTDVGPAPTDPPTPEPSPTGPPPEHRIGVEGQTFIDRQTGQPFVPRGVNYAFVPASGGGYALKLLQVGVYDGARTRADFAQLAGYGYNTVRVFLDHCNEGAGCIGDADNEGLNPAYLDNIADMTLSAREAGVVILFTSNDLPNQGGYAEEANSQAGETFGGYRNSYYLTPGAISATRRYWRDLLTGLAERGAAFDAVLGWELLNEQWMFADQPPLSLTAGTVTTTTGSYDMSDPTQKARMVSEGLIYYIAQMREEILTHDPTALVTMGFFVPELVAPGWYVETASLLEAADLDFFDFHAYPGGASLADHAAAFGMAGFEAKPIVMGEYGAFRHLYSERTAAAQAITRWVAESCGQGFDGWLYWTYYPANADAGDRTWGLTDDDGYLLELLAPVNQPDPCTAPAISGGNLAAGKPVTASAALPDQPAAAAVDQNDGSNWGSGGGAPAWIEVDLEGTYRVTEIRLLAAQYPEGDTVHRIEVRGPGGGYTQAHTFSGFTRDGDWLIFTPPAPLEGVTAVRVLTTASPSWVAWREVQVFGEPAP